MTEPHAPRRRDDGGPSFAWLVPLALTGLVVVLAWRLYKQGVPDTHDPGAQARPVAARGNLAEDERTTIELFRAASPAVVHVTNLQRGTDWSGRNELEIPQGTGTGFVWDAQGYIVTNFHVVMQGDAFTVALADHTQFDATLVGKDPVHDLAVLKIDAAGRRLPVLPIGTSSDLLVGQKVFAIGNPFGLDQTLTTGIISGLNREIVSPYKTPIRGVVQTDAAINPGNSGGPLLDSAGRVIGMNTQIASPSGASAGVGFAIPVDTLNRVVPPIIRTGHFQRPGLGVVDLREGVIDRGGRRGVIFLGFAETSAAEKAGLRATLVTPDGRLRQMGDAIVGLGGRPVESSADLFRILDAAEIGQEIEVSYVRDGKEHSAKLKLAGVQSD